ncbi:MAG TPA: biotin carboxylase N-terminal domain-containing protein [Steroidobacteraceae bacterium]
MIKSLLVANRGEIACRIFRTARRLGIHTIAVYSDADAGSRHTREADEAVRIGPAAARDSYLNITKVLEAARASGAQAIHPGYGFLSENAQFAQACVDAGIIFVGPPASAMNAMSSKITAKTRMHAAGVPVLPGYAGAEQGLEQLAREARNAGFPLIIKPAAGGGGKGMQIVREESELVPGLAAARRLAESAFGDGALLLERYLPAPRHIEVQVFADTHGNFVHLGDRDCSTQRRHQKLIEEAPAPAMPDAVRKRLRAAAIVVAREVGYVSAGTVEFLFDGHEFYFMEMNTRLQVEHTVTEAITGLDLVAWQLRVACGEALPLTQEQLRFDGHAIEARVCAEDPEARFLPSAGHLHRLEWPRMEHVRVDAGFATGDTVPDCYDSLLGKIIAWGADRDQAAARLATALRETYSAGVHTNERWLARILASPRFLKVRHNIALLDKGAAEFAGSATPAPVELILAALAAHQGVAAAHNPWEVRDAFTPNLPALISYSFSWRGQSHTVELEYAAGQPSAASVAGRSRLALASVTIAPELVAAQVDERRHQARYQLAGAHVYLWTAQDQYDFVIEDPRTREFSASVAKGGLTTPLPGVVVSVPVKVGQKVSVGEVLMVIEAMKMEHTITAPYAGTVETIHFAQGARVPEGSELLALTASPEGGAA